jgi:hypothetical protein
VSEVIAQEFIALLRTQATEISEEGHLGWGNSMVHAADMIAELSAWKAESVKVMGHLMDYARENCTAPLGCSLTEWLVADHKALRDGQSANARLIAALELIVSANWSSSETATDFALSQTGGFLISQMKEIARDALAAAQVVSGGRQELLEMEWLEQWLLLAAEPVGQDCCGQAHFECCGNAIPVYRTADDIAAAMNTRREELRVMLAVAPKQVEP